MAHRDKLWSFCVLLSSRGGGLDDTRRQVMVIRTLLLSVRLDEINAQRQIMVILRPLSFRNNKLSDKHAEKNYGHSALFIIQEQQVE